MMQWYIDQHEKDSDQRLRELVIENHKKINAIPSDAPDATEEAQKLLDELQACKELLDRRKAKADSQKQWLQDWKKEEPARRNRAILNLPHAVSANGQLVAAILEEEDFLTGEQLLTWCDELSQLSQEEGEELLAGLCEEGILRKDEQNRYQLITVCTEKLYPVQIERWMNVMVSPFRPKSTHYKLDWEELTMVLTDLSANGAPMEAEELAERLLFNMNRNGTDVKKCKDRLCSSLRELVDAGLMTQPKRDCFWLRMLGSKE